MIVTGYSLLTGMGVQLGHCRPFFDLFDVNLYGRFSDIERNSRVP
jgi:hypothetical protein